MKWMRLDYIKQHSRLDYNDEDALLELYADAAEQSVLNYIGRTYEEVVEMWDGVPDSLRIATLMVVDHIYQNRGMLNQQKVEENPAFELFTKPYMKLHTSRGRH